MRDPYQLYPHDKLLGATLIRLIPRFVLPNHLTVLRFLLTPLVLWFLWVENYAVGIPFFLFVAFTDVLDGTLARVRKQVTEWGMMFDPVADKLLIGAVLLLIVFRFVNPVLAVLIVSLDVLATIVGGVQAWRGKVMMANYWGKAKMFFQVVGITCLLIAVYLGVDIFVPLSNATLFLAVIFAVLSMLRYGI